MPKSHNRYRLARRTRIVVSMAITLLITATIAEFAWMLTPVGKWLCSVQMLTAISTLSIVWATFWLATTLVFGRIYCSSVCPLGTVMDTAAHIGVKTRGHIKGMYHYALPRNPLRIFIVACVASTVIFGTTSLVSILNPFNIYQRTTSLATALVNGATMTTAAMIPLFTAAVLFAASAVVSWKKGRLVCNSVCPVGTILALAARSSALHLDINTDLCTNCYDCAHVCKAQAINIPEHSIDQSRCIMCMNCAAACNNNAITYRTGRHQLKMPLANRLSSTPTPTPTLNASSHLSQNARQKNAKHLT